MRLASSVSARVVLPDTLNDHDRDTHGDHVFVFTLSLVTVVVITAVLTVSPARAVRSEASRECTPASAGQPSAWTDGSGSASWLSGLLAVLSG